MKNNFMDDGRIVKVVSDPVTLASLMVLSGQECLTSLNFTALWVGRKFAKSSQEYKKQNDSVVSGAKNSHDKKKSMCDECFKKNEKEV